MFDADVARLPSGTSNLSTGAERRRRSLRQSAEALILAHPSVIRLSDNGSIEDMADALMIGADDFAAINVAVFGRAVTLVCVCSAAWRGPARHLFFELKAAAAVGGRNVILVPERFIRREPRLTNALMIAGAQGAEIGLSDRMKILAHLVENGGSAPLLDLAVMVRGEEPVSAIMALVVEGGLYIDLDGTILPSTSVHLVQPL
jgi:hypothetical protein